MTESAEALAPVTAATIGFGLSATNWEAGFKIAKVLADSELVPKAYQGKPADVVVAMQYGAEIGLPPMASLQSIAVINGRPGVYGDGFLGVIMASPHYLKHREYYVTGKGEIVQALRGEDLQDDETRAVSQFWRRGVPEPFAAEFSVGDAKRAKLWNKDGPWQQYPARQLLWRARGFAGRNGFAAELRGITIAAELEDLPIVEEEPLPERPPMPTPTPESEAPKPAPNPLTPNPARPPAVSSSPSTRRKPAGSSSPSPSSQAGNSSGLTVESMVITETAYVESKDEDPFYEVRARVEKPGQAPVGYIFLTRNKDLYELAQSAEGTPQTFTILWSKGKRRDGTECKVLESLAAS